MKDGSLDHLTERREYFLRVMLSPINLLRVRKILTMIRMMTPASEKYIVALKRKKKVTKKKKTQRNLNLQKWKQNKLSRIHHQNSLLLKQKFQLQNHQK